MPQVTGDIRIEFFHHEKMICYASFNTAFVGGNLLTLVWHCLCLCLGGYSRFFESLCALSTSDLV